MTDVFEGCAVNSLLTYSEFSMLLDSLDRWRFGALKFLTLRLVTYCWHVKRRIQKEEKQVWRFRNQNVFTMSKSLKIIVFGTCHVVPLFLSNVRVAIVFLLRFNEFNSICVKTESKSIVKSIDQNTEKIFVKSVGFTFSYRINLHTKNFSIPSISIRKKNFPFYYL